MITRSEVPALRRFDANMELTNRDPDFGFRVGTVWRGDDHETYVVAAIEPTGRVLVAELNRVSVTLQEDAIPIEWSWTFGQELDDYSWKMRVRPFELPRGDYVLLGWLHPVDAVRLEYYNGVVCAHADQSALRVSSSLPADCGDLHASYRDMDQRHAQLVELRVGLDYFVTGREDLDVIARAVRKGVTDGLPFALTPINEMEPT